MTKYDLLTEDALRLAKRTDVRPDGASWTVFLEYGDRGRGKHATLAMAALRAIVSADKGLGPGMCDDEVKRMIFAQLKVRDRTPSEERLFRALFYEVDDDSS